MVLTESISVLNPVCSRRGLTRNSACADVLEIHIGAVHDIDRPEGRLVDVEVLDMNVGDIPEMERLVVVSNQVPYPTKACKYIPWAAL